MIKLLSHISSAIFTRKAVLLLVKLEKPDTLEEMMEMVQKFSLREDGEDKEDKRKKRVLAKRFQEKERWWTWHGCSNNDSTWQPSPTI